jgi:hypothetical protein
VRVGRQFKLVAIGLLLSLLASTASADELRRLYAQILRDPSNTELNFRYAELAEQRGEIRKALSAYERILVNDPDNPHVRAALQRVRRMLQPDTTQFLAELGAAYETNPRRLANKSDDGAFLARISMRDERKFGNGMRWRTIGQIAGDIYFDNSDLRYGYAGAYTGPLIDITPAIAMHAAVGGSAAYFDNRLYYSEAIANVTFESYLEGAYHTVRVRTGYRDFNSGFSSGDGMYADVIGRFSFADLLGPETIVSFSPWYRWSDFGGTGFSLLIPTEQVQPGKYNEYGARIEFNKRLLDWLSFGAGVSVSQRDYAAGFDFLALVTTNRRDVMIAPHATLTFHKVMGEQTDLRLHYRYEHNDSNVAVRDFENHISTLMLVSRF